MGEPDDLEWAQRLVDGHVTVMHVETRTVGRAKALYDERGQLYVPPGASAPLKDPVLELENGHSFLAKAGAFIEFEQREVDAYAAATSALRAGLVEATRFAAARGVQPPTAAMLMAAALRQQLRELEKAFPTARPPAPAAE